MNIKMHQIGESQVLFDLEAGGSIADFRKIWAVYFLRNGLTGDIIHVGSQPMTKIFSFGDVVDNPKINLDDRYQIEIVELHENKGMADRSVAEQIRRHNLHDLLKAKAAFKNGQIRCIDTGELFGSVPEAARAHNCDQGALYKHVQRKPGFKTVKGKMYERVSAEQYYRGTGQMKVPPAPKPAVEPPQPVAQYAPEGYSAYPKEN